MSLRVKAALNNPNINYSDNRLLTSQLCLQRISQLRRRAVEATLSLVSRRTSMSQSLKIVKILRSSWRKSSMKHWKDETILKRSQRLLNRLFRKVVPLQEMKSLKLR